MKKLFGKCSGLILTAMFLFTGCAVSPNGYIETLTPGNSNRVLGKYPGKPNKEGIVAVNVVGKGIPPENAISKGQAILMAERAALADGYRKMAERINGIYIQAYLKAGRETIDYDLIRIETETWLRGVQVLEIKHRDNDIAEAYLRTQILVASDSILYGNEKTHRQNPHK